MLIFTGIAVINDNFENNLINLISIPVWGHNYFTKLRKKYVDILGDDVKLIRVELDHSECILDYLPIPNAILPYHKREVSIFKNGLAIPDNSCVGGYRLTKMSRISIANNSNFLETFNIKNIMFNYLESKISKHVNTRLFYIHSEKRYLLVSATEEELNGIHYKLTVSNKFNNNKGKIFILDTFRNKIEVEISDVKFFTERELKRQSSLLDDKESFDLLVTHILSTEIDEYFYNLYNSYL